MTCVRHHVDSEGLPYYSVSEDSLEAGASLGNGRVWAPVQAHGAVESVFCIAAGAPLLGAFRVRYGARAGEGYVPLEPDGPALVELHPTYQRRHLTLGTRFAAEETVFCPLGPQDDPPLVYVAVNLRNLLPTAQDVRVVGLGRLAGGPSGDVLARFEPRLNALLAADRHDTARVRALGATCAPIEWAATLDWGPAYDPVCLALPAGRCEGGDTLGGLQVTLPLAPEGTYHFSFILAVGAEGEGPLRTALRRGRDHRAVLQGTRAYLGAALAEGRVLTPDPVINDGALWSKVNMRRIMAQTHQGAVFSNDPGKSAAVVGRDAAWFCYGADHAWPEFSRALLENFVRVQASDGKIPEFFSSVDGSAEDDGLNINDDTPLFILACAHHVACTRDHAWAQRIFPAVARAADCLLRNRDERGLVTCTAEDPRGNVWASATWRNIIPGYSLNGAVTEINAESVAALRAASELAGLVPGHEAAEERFMAAGRALQEAMDQHLLNPESGLYYLNIDTRGHAHADVTGDLVFPVLFGACADETAKRITQRLSMADLWTGAGLRTVSARDPRFDPSKSVGLLGGVWPGLTWWYAFSCRRHHPEMMARALRSSFAHYASDPKTYNTVPGQFSEWFDGQSLANRGMRLSSWEPPRFLWAAVEGVCGYEPSVRGPAVDPCFPPGWTWVGVRGLPCGDGRLSYVAASVGGFVRVWATREVWAPGTVEVYPEDVSDAVAVRGRHVVHVALARPGCLWLFLGGCSSHAACTSVDLSAVLRPEGTYRLARCDGLGGWTEQAPALGRALAALPVTVDSGGFVILEARDA